MDRMIEQVYSLVDDERANHISELFQQVAEGKSYCPYNN